MLISVTDLIGTFRFPPHDYENGKYPLKGFALDISQNIRYDTLPQRAGPPIKN